MMVAGLLRSSRICFARACTWGLRASCSKPATSIEMGKGRATTRRAGLLPRAGTSITDSWSNTEQAAGRSREIAGIRHPLKTDHVGSEQTLDDLGAPRQLREDPVCRERDVVEVPDGEVGSGLAQHPGDQLQLVVVTHTVAACAETAAIALAKRWLTLT
jgi:hypothetical protein